jgi:hypothetical protein
VHIKKKIKNKCNTLKSVQSACASVQVVQKQAYVPAHDFMYQFINVSDFKRPSNHQYEPDQTSKVICAQIP